jgi:adenylate cyclase
MVSVNHRGAARSDMERRLAAILIADVAGYSRLSQIDEEATRHCFQADLNEVILPKIVEHHGRLVKTMGDGLLVEFHSVVNALQCATEIQREKALRNASVDSASRLEFRIGVNLGDVIVEDEDIHGDGVNIADRMQKLAEPGGIAISGTTYDQVKSKVNVGYASVKTFAAQPHRHSCRFTDLLRRCGLSVAAMGF